MIRIEIDGTIYEVKEGKNLLETCIALGIDVPYFCYHGALGSVGACRQCAVKKYAKPEDKNGKIVMSCMEPVTDGMLVSVRDKDAVDFRAGVVEGLMANHPHDCPVCDEGGECHLQDMTVMTGHNYRRYIFKKRTYTNQFLGPFVHHEMNRCIQCYRCVRYYRDYAGGHDLDVFGSANRVFFGRQQDGILESEFSGNLVEVCPTGVFTDETLKEHYTRKWDLTNGPSVCVHCSVGCNTILSERYGTLRRTLSRYHGDINGYFLCDRGRYGYEFANSEKRNKSILFRATRTALPVEVSDLSMIQGLSESLKSGRIMGIGSPRASLEANYALSALTGKDNFYLGISRREHSLVNMALDILNDSRLQVASLKDIEKADAVVILGEDITQTAPMMALAVRQAIRNKSFRDAEKLGIPAWNDAAVRQLNHSTHSPLYIASPYPTKLDDIATAMWYGAPDDIARIGFLSSSLVNDPNALSAEKDDPLKNYVAAVVKSLKDAERPLIITGTGSGSEMLLAAASKLAEALVSGGKKPSIAIAFAESNTAGLCMLRGDSIDAALESIEKQPPEVLVILENDLYRRLTPAEVDSILEKCGKVIVIDSIIHETARKADLVLPAAIYAESEGTLVNYEGRAQRYYSALPVNRPVMDNWNWIITLMNMAGKNPNQWNQFDQITDYLADDYPAFDPIRDQMPDAGFRYYNEKIARQTSRFSGRTAMNANLNVSEPAPPKDQDSPLKYSMEGYKGKPPAELIPYYWAPGWNSVQAVNKYLDEPEGALKDGNPGIKIFPVAGRMNRIPSMAIPEPFNKREKELYFVSVYRIFGSEELSSYGKAIGKLIPKPFVWLSESTAEKIEKGENKIVTVELNEQKVEVEIIRDNHVPDGIAAISYQLPGMPSLNLPGWGKIL